MRTAGETAGVGRHRGCHEDNIESTKEIRGNESGRRGGGGRDARRNGISNISLAVIRSDGRFA